METQVNYTNDQVLELLGEIIPEMNDIRYNLLELQHSLNELANLIELSGTTDVSSDTDEA